jgi:hypothetical protein
MKNVFYLIAGAFIFTACSAPKYAYHFDHYDYNSGRKQAKTETASATETSSPLLIDETTLVADAAPLASVSSSELKTGNAVSNTSIKKVADMSKTEKKELKQVLKSYVKSIKKGDIGKGTDATKAWDHDLKMAAIFGAVGVVLTALGGFNTVFWILGTIALVIGVVFLIKWLARQ